LADELRILRERLTEVACRRPDWAGRIGGLLDACERVPAALPERSGTPLHRDFHPDQVLVHGGRLYLLDLDLCAEGDAAVDAGNFIAHLSEMALRTQGDATSLAARERAFLGRFLGLTPLATRAGVEAYAFLSLARLVHVSLRMPERIPSSEALLRLCEVRGGRSDSWTFREAGCHATSA
jgi:Ser/Thr protein kinase RdoA (MazF antagonist)